MLVSQIDYLEEMRDECVTLDGMRYCQNKIDDIESTLKNLERLILL